MHATPCRNDNNTTNKSFPPFFSSLLPKSVQNQNAKHPYTVEFKNKGTYSLDLTPLKLYRVMWHVHSWVVLALP